MTDYLIPSDCQVQHYHCQNGYYNAQKKLICQFVSLSDSYSCRIRNKALKIMSDCLHLGHCVFQHLCSQQTLGLRVLKSRTVCHWLSFFLQVISIINRNSTDISIKYLIHSEHHLLFSIPGTTASTKTSTLLILSLIYSFDYKVCAYLDLLHLLQDLLLCIS